MSDYKTDLNLYLNDVIDSYDLRCESDIKSLPYPETVLGYAAIEIQHNDDALECLYESKNFNDLKSILCANLTMQTQETQEDFNDSVNEIIADYYKEDFKELLQNKMQQNYQEGMIGKGFNLHMNKENGEFTWIKSGVRS
jgi:hypothetical protein